jgi:phosphoribosylanthranilate isomerase
MKLKVCGMRQKENIEALEALKPDFMGLIFYEKSARHAEGMAKPKQIRAMRAIQKVGVFVNAPEAYMVRQIEQYALRMVQLHGQESPDTCAFMQSLGVNVIKVFSVGDGFDFASLRPYEDHVDYFLFDTKGKLPGGNGVRFNWEILQDYNSEKPFFLSGGIGPESVDKLRQFSHPQLFALDINSRFEIEPGLKDIEKIRAFQKSL